MCQFLFRTHFSVSLLFLFCCFALIDRQAQTSPTPTPISTPVATSTPTPGFTVDVTFMQSGDGGEVVLVPDLDFYEEGTFLRILVLYSYPLCLEETGHCGQDSLTDLVSNVPLEFEGRVIRNNRWYESYTAVVDQDVELKAIYMFVYGPYSTPTPIPSPTLLPPTPTTCCPPTPTPTPTENPSFSVVVTVLDMFGDIRERSRYIVLEPDQESYEPGTTLTITVQKNIRHYDEDWDGVILIWEEYLEELECNVELTKEGDYGDFGDTYSIYTTTVNQNIELTATYYDIVIGEIHPTATPTPSATPTPPPTPNDDDGVGDECETADPALLVDGGWTHLWLPDSDGDGLLDGQEDMGNCEAVTSTPLALTDPTNADTDGDGLSDGIEVLFLETDPLDATDPPTVEDADGDGLPASIDPNDQSTDTDGDGFGDACEVLAGSDPASAADVPPLGDVNGDGSAQNLDAIMIFNWSLGNVPVQAMSTIGNADVQTNGLINNMDAIILFNWTLGNVAVIPM